MGDTMNSITENYLISQLLKRKIVSINEDKPILMLPVFYGYMIKLITMPFNKQK